MGDLIESANPTVGAAERGVFLRKKNAELLDEENREIESFMVFKN
jgi:hypothetical protein